MRFSVIVPVFQIKDYLPQCADSILSQTWDDFEVILVDDGSTDGSTELCREYAARDRRVKVVEKANGGLVSARKAGLDAASGEYVINVDGDDWIAPELLRQADRILSEFRPDLISFGFYDVCGERAALRLEPVPEGFYGREAMREAIYPRLLLNRNEEHMFYFLAGKVIRRELLYRRQMEVDPGIAYGEDLVCAAPVYMDAKSVYISSLPMYYYRHHRASISGTFRMERYDQLRLCIESLSRHEPEGIGDYQEQLDRYALYECLVLLVTASRGRNFSCVPAIRACMGREPFKSRIADARFGRVPPKAAAMFWLLQRGRVGSAYLLSCACNWLKGALGRDG